MVVAADGGSSEFAKVDWQSPMFEDFNHAVRGLAIEDYDQDGIEDIWRGEENTSIAIYSGKDYSEIGRIEIPHPISYILSMNVVDIDVDEHVDVVLYYKNLTYHRGMMVLNTTSGEANYINDDIDYLTEVRVGNIDDDPISEIVIIGGVPEYGLHVMDGVEHTMEWSFPFHSYNDTGLSLIDVTDDGILEVLLGYQSDDENKSNVYNYFNDTHELIIFDGSDGSVIARRSDFQEEVMAMGYSNDTLWVGTGVFGFYRHGRVHMMDAKTLEDLHVTDDLYRYIYSIKPHDVDRDGLVDVVIGSEQSLMIFNETLEKKYETLNSYRSGRYDEMWIGDIDQDNLTDIIVNVHDGNFMGDDLGQIYVLELTGEPPIRPNATTINKAEAETWNRITLAWNRSNDAEFHSYHIYANQGPEYSYLYWPGGKVIIDQNETEYVVFGLEENTTYHCMVRVWGLDGLYNDSETITITTPVNLPPGAIDSVEFFDIESGNLRMKWEPNNELDFDTYQVYLSEFSNITPSQDTYYGRYNHHDLRYGVRILGLEPSTEYFFIVRVEDEGDLYADSSVFNVTTAEEMVEDEPEDSSAACSPLLIVMASITVISILKKGRSYRH